MKIRLLSPLLSFAIVFGGLNLAVLTIVPQEVHASEEETELSGHMEEISKTFRRVRRQIRDASKNEDSAALVAIMLERAKASLALEPAWTADQPDSEQAEFVAGFKKEMKAFVAMLEDLHAAFKAGDNDKAAEVVAKLRDQQKKGHDGYKKPDDE